MKAFSLVLAALTLSVSAHSNEMIFTCKNPDGTVIVTGDKLVHLQFNVTQQYTLIVLNSATTNTMPKAGEVLEFKNDDVPWLRAASLKITSISNRERVSGHDGAPCEGGRGPGYYTEAYALEGELELAFNSPQKVSLSCLESAHWAGSCVSP